jgi:hypothetical protein
MAIKKKITERKRTKQDKKMARASPFFLMLSIFHGVRAVVLVDSTEGRKEKE